MSGVVSVSPGHVESGVIKPETVICGVITPVTVTEGVITPGRVTQGVVRAAVPASNVEACLVEVAPW